MTARDRRRQRRRRAKRLEAWRERRDADLYDRVRGMLVLLRGSRIRPAEEPGTAFSGVWADALRWR